MKQRAVKPWFFMLSVLIIGFSVLAFFGIKGTAGDFVKTYIRGIRDIEWDTSSDGGLDITFTAVEGEEVLPERVRDAAVIIEKRLSVIGLKNYYVSADLSEKKIFVSIIWDDEEADVDFYRVISDITVNSNIVFIMGEPESPDSMSDSDQFVLGGGNISNAQVKYTDDSHIRYIEITLNQAGIQAALKLRSESPDKIVTVWMDNLCLYRAPVAELFNEAGVVRLTNGDSSYDAKYADRIAAYISAGAIPFDLEPLRYEFTESYSENINDRILIVSGAFILAAVCIFMIINYKLPGVVACISIIGQTAGVIAFITGFFNFEFIKTVPMSAPAVAGFMLTIGMGAYANVIVNERIKDEVIKGKNLRSAVVAGCANSAPSVLDGNLTAMISGIIIMGLSAGKDKLCSWIMKPLFFAFPVVLSESIYSLGYILFFGSILNFLFGVIFTGLMLKSLTCYSIFSDRRLYGEKRIKEVDIK